MSKMKFILPLVFCLLTASVNAQPTAITGPDTSMVITQDSLVYFTHNEVLTLANKIRLMQDSIRYHNDLIDSKDSLISLYQQRSVVFKDQIANREETIRLFEEQERIMRETILDLQPKWYDNKMLWFGSGAASTILILLLLQR